MFLKLFQALRIKGVPVTLREYLDLLGGLNSGLCQSTYTDGFYNFSKICLIKDEKYYDKFDIVFKNFYEENYKNIENLEKKIPENWIFKELEKVFSEEFKKTIKNEKGWEEILKEFKKKIEEQKKRHEGGNKWIGTGGTSMFGNSGYNPKGIRVGGAGGNKNALKIWEKRFYQKTSKKN